MKLDKLKELESLHTKLGGLDFGCGCCGGDNTGDSMDWAERVFDLFPELVAAAEQATEIERLNARVRELEEALPKTADGVPVYPGMKAIVLPVAGPNRMVPTECIVDMITGDALNGQPEKIHVWIATDENYGGYTPEHLLFSKKENADIARTALGKEPRHDARTPQQREADSLDRSLDHQQ